MKASATPTRDFLTTEEQKALGNALHVLSGNHKCLILVAPKDAPEKFLTELTIWNNYILDIGMLPPLALPAVRIGDYLVCPFCKMPVSTDLSHHTPDCEWKEAVSRWAVSMTNIDKMLQH